MASNRPRGWSESAGQDARYWLDYSKARRELGWEPRIPFEEGIREVMDWVETYWEQIRREPLHYRHKA